jgi:hypothetical protein
MSKFLLNEATCVVVGAWNLAILNPRWIATEILKLPEKTQIPIEMAIGPSISLKASISDLFITPGSDRIIISPAREDKALFQVADKIINDLYATLPHTPITAIGYNFSYELEEGEEFAIAISFEATRFSDVFKTFGAAAGSSSMIQHSLALYEDAYVVLNLVQKMEETKKSVAMNYHYQTNNDKKQIENSLNKFLSSYKHSQAAISKLIKKEVA